MHEIKKIKNSRPKTYLFKHITSYNIWKGLSYLQQLGLWYCIILQRMQLSSLWMLEVFLLMFVLFLSAF